MNYLEWSLLLAVQQFSFVVVSRARNSDNLWYGGIASVFSNGIWFMQSLLLTDGMIKVLRDSDWTTATKMGILYVTVNAVFAVIAQKVCMKWFEKK